MKDYETTYKNMLIDKGWFNDVQENYVWHKADSNIYLDTLLNDVFDYTFGCSNGYNFVIITKDWVYFPSTYDGAEDVERMPRNPNDKFEPYHVGGE